MKSRKDTPNLDQMVPGQRHTAQVSLDVIHIARTDAMERPNGKPAVALQALELELRLEHNTTQTIQERISSLASKGKKDVVVRLFQITM